MAATATQTVIASAAVSTGTWVVFSLSGEVDPSTCRQLVDALTSSPSAEVVVIDCTDLDFIDSWGLNAIQAAREATPGTRFEMRNTSPFHQRLVSIAGMSSLLSAT